nr:probable arabinosyltransferase ARAD1 [Ipomoea batatas]
MNDKSQKMAVDTVKQTEAWKRSRGRDHVFVLTDPIAMWHVKASLLKDVTVPYTLHLFTSKELSISTGNACARRSRKGAVSTSLAISGDSSAISGEYGGILRRSGVSEFFGLKTARCCI